MQKVLTWWERGLIFALGLSVALLGVGRVEFLSGGSFSSWSVSRTTFFFWLTFKVVLWVRSGWGATDLRGLTSLKPLFVFFAVVTVSLLPEFRIAGDYRYFLFGCAHSIMVVDLFARPAQKRWLPLLCGLLPIVLVARGFASDSSVWDLVLTHRFGFPLDHANTAGYVFAMSIPLAFAVLVAGSLAWRSLGAASLLSQILALFLTYSRGAWLGCATALLFLLAATRKWKYLMAMGVLAVAGLLLVPSLRDRLLSLSRPYADSSLSERSSLFGAALRVGIEHPFLGVGYGRGRLKEAIRPHLRGTPLEGKGVLHSHNVYVEIFAGTGLLGLLALLWLLGTVLLRLVTTARKQLGARRILGYGLAASWLAAIVVGIGDIPFYHHETRIFFFTLIGAAHLYWSSGGNHPAL